jgi:hypothetical protein
VFRIFHDYRQNVHPFWQILLDIDEFESKLCTYLETRVMGSNNDSEEDNPGGIPIQWFAILFAVLASGIQFSDLAREQRLAQSRTYGRRKCSDLNTDCAHDAHLLLVQTSFECLRLANFLLQPSIESIQALLVVNHVLQNDMNAEAAWALLGMTSRLAQSLGLHRESRGSGTVSDQSKRLWYAPISIFRIFNLSVLGGHWRGKTAYSRCHLIDYL